MGRYLESDEERELGSRSPCAHRARSVQRGYHPAGLGCSRGSGEAGGEPKERCAEGEGSDGQGREGEARRRESEEGGPEAEGRGSEGEERCQRAGKGKTR